MLIYGIFTAMMATVYLKVPGGFIPDEDQGQQTCMTTAGVASARRD
jgi:hypothetical protein